MEQLTFFKLIISIERYFSSMLFMSKGSLDHFNYRNARPFRTPHFARCMLRVASIRW